MEVKNIDTRNIKLIKDYIMKGLAYSHLNYDDSGFYAAFSWETSVSSDTGPDLKFYDPKRFKDIRDAFRQKEIPGYVREWHQMGDYFIFTIRNGIGMIRGEKLYLITNGNEENPE